MSEWHLWWRPETQKPEGIPYWDLILGVYDDHVTVMDFTGIFKTALAKPYPLMVLREALIQLRSQGVEKEVLLAALESFRSQLDEQNEDVVLDAMDLLVGNCSPHMRIE